jgi:enolase-phosphatase E1
MAIDAQTGRTGPAAVRGVLTDIEGTTTAMSFVHDVLFPYAAARLDEVCAARAGEPEIAAALALLRADHAAEAGPVPPFGDGAAYARRLMAEDRKSTGLKALQGLIWEGGYRGGELCGHVFPDVPPALAAWRAAGVRLRVFSSGSASAQRLLFGHTGWGDLTPLFDGFHDTTTGPKQAAESYRAIAAAFALPPASLLFLSDTVGELDAAAAAGYQTGQLERPGNRPQSASDHPTYISFAELAPRPSPAAMAAVAAVAAVAPRPSPAAAGAAASGRTTP